MTDDKLAIRDFVDFTNPTVPYIVYPSTDVLYKLDNRSQEEIYKFVSNQLYKVFDKIVELPVDNELYSNFVKSFGKNKLTLSKQEIFDGINEMCAHLVDNGIRNSISKLGRLYSWKPTHLLIPTKLSEVIEKDKSDFFDETGCGKLDNGVIVKKEVLLPSELMYMYNEETNQSKIIRIDYTNETKTDISDRK